MCKISACQKTSTNFLYIDAWGLCVKKMLTKRKRCGNISA